MAQKSIIRKDHVGLYAVAGGYIIRPAWGTIFKEGDEVKTHHFGGSSKAGVTYNDSNYKFRNPKDYEVWTTTGGNSSSYKKKEFEPNKYSKIYGKEYSTWEEYEQLSFEWYAKRYPAVLMQDHNDRFKQENVGGGNATP